MTSECFGSVKALLSPSGGLKMTIIREKPPADTDSRSPASASPAVVNDNDWVTETREGSGIGKLVFKRKGGSTTATPSPEVSHCSAVKKPSPGPRNVIRLSFMPNANDGMLVAHIKNCSSYDTAPTLPVAGSDDIVSVSEMSPACHLQPSPKDSGIDISSPPRDDGHLTGSVTGSECQDDPRTIQISTSPTVTTLSETDSNSNDCNMSATEKHVTTNEFCSILDCNNRIEQLKIQSTLRTKAERSVAIIRRRPKRASAVNKSKTKNTTASKTLPSHWTLQSSGNSTFKHGRRAAPIEESATYNLPTLQKKEKPEKPVERVVLRLKQRVTGMDNGPETKCAKKVKIEGGAGSSLRFKYCVRGETETSRHQYYVETPEHNLDSNKSSKITLKADEKSHRPSSKRKIDNAIASSLMQVKTEPSDEIAEMCITGSGKRQSQSATHKAKKESTSRCAKRRGLNEISDNSDFKHDCVTDIADTKMESDTLKLLVAETVVDNIVSVFKIDTFDNDADRLQSAENPVNGTDDASCRDVSIGSADECCSHEGLQNVVSIESSSKDIANSLPNMPMKGGKSMPEEIDTNEYSTVATASSGFRTTEPEITCQNLSSSSECMSDNGRSSGAEVDLPCDETEVLKLRHCDPGYGYDVIFDEDNDYRRNTSNGEDKLIRQEDNTVLSTIAYDASDIMSDTGQQSEELVDILPSASKCPRVNKPESDGSLHVNGKNISLSAETDLMEDCKLVNCANLYGETVDSSFDCNKNNESIVSSVPVDVALTVDELEQTELVPVSSSSQVFNANCRLGITLPEMQTLLTAHCSVSDDLMPYCSPKNVSSDPFWNIHGLSPSLSPPQQNVSVPGKSFMTEYAKFISNGSLDSKLKEEYATLPDNTVVKQKPVNECKRIGHRSLSADQKFNRNVCRRRKPFAENSLLIRSCSKCKDMRHRSTSLSSLHVDSYMTSYRTLIRLRLKVVEMLQSIFPSLDYPAGFRRDSSSVEKLIDRILHVLRPNETRTDLNNILLCSEPFVDLCLLPDQCTNLLRKKIVQLVSALLPNLDVSDIDDNESIEVLLELLASHNLPISGIIGLPCSSTVNDLNINTKMPSCAFQYTVPPSGLIVGTSRFVEPLLSKASTKMPTFDSAAASHSLVSPATVSSAIVHKKTIKRQVKDCLMFLEQDLT